MLGKKQSFKNIIRFNKYIFIIQIIKRFARINQQLWLSIKCAKPRGGVANITPPTSSRRSQKNLRSDILEKVFGSAQLKDSKKYRTTTPNVYKTIDIQ